MHLVDGVQVQKQQREHFLRQDSVPRLRLFGHLISKPLRRKVRVFSASSCSFLLRCRQTYHIENFQILFVGPLRHENLLGDEIRSLSWITLKIKGEQDSCKKVDLGGKSMRKK